MQPGSDLLLSTLLSLPDDRRAALERHLVALTRAAALGELTADVAHDVANPLFGVMGLVDLLLEDAPTGSEEAARLQLLQRTTLEMKGSLQGLLDFARLAGDDTARASLAGAAAEATRLLRHGARRTLAVEERYPAEPVDVPCPRGQLVQAILQLLLAGRADGKVVVEVDGSSLRLSPAPETTLGSVVAARIVSDSGGTVERDERSVTLRWTG
jgi:signal transduction histidine kinase